MTPKEKAKELVEKYAIWSWNETVCDYDVAKQCALIAVNEVIQELIVTDFANRFPYWQEVKKEIENL
jgi:hypothetical protein